MIEALISWGPAAAWAVVLFFLSQQGDLGKSDLFAHADKLAHLSLYAVLGATLAWGRGWRRSPIPHWLLVLAGVLYGASDELHQSWVPGRSPSAVDLVADGLGVIVGYALLLRFWPGRRITAAERSVSLG
ncbi:MAG: VanZ family protein [Gemmatimonadetes bacterium]|nr:VanZ family protein [Gemmatimonadota bacterium]